MPKNIKLNLLHEHICSASLKSFWISLGLLLLTLVIFAFGPTDWYGQNIFPIIRQVLNLAFGYLPVPAFGIFFTLFIAYVLVMLIYAFKSSYQKFALLRLGQACSFLPVIFFWLWGFHYAIDDYRTFPDLDEVKISAKDIEQTIAAMEFYRRQLLTPADSFSSSWDLTALDQITSDGEKWLNEAFASVQIPNKRIAVKIRQWPKGFLLRWGISGNYLPFTGEPTLDPGLHGLRMPSTALHELAHSAGISGEGACNFYAYLSALFSRDPFMIYSALIEKLRDELHLLAITDFDTYELAKNQVPEYIGRDLLSIRNHHAHYRGIMSDAGNWMNDRYLKSLGIEDGVDNYYKWVLAAKLLVPDAREIPAQN